MAPPKPKSAKEARRKKELEKMGKDPETLKVLEKESKRKNGPVKKDKKKEEKVMKKRYGGSVKKMARGGKVKKMARGGKVKKMARGGIVKGPYS
jgi:hypothetical protein